MSVVRKRRKRSVYNGKRYWYHVSTTLKDKYVELIPWDEYKGFNRSGNEPPGKRICVAPSIEQCIAAIPYTFWTTLNIYRTRKKVIAKPAKDVFDAKVTKEGWLHEPTEFLKLGILKFKDVEKGLVIENVIEEAASSGDSRQSGKVLKWWKKTRIKRFLKKA